MASQVQKSSSSGENGWAPFRWDMYGNASQVLEGLKRKADVRANFSPRELGSDAGRFILDQYYAAKGETGIGTVTQAMFSLSNIKLLFSKILPLAGLIAAIGIDFAVFGSASADIASVDMPFGLNPFAVGSLVFAAGIGIAKASKDWVTAIPLYGTMIVATLGAAFLSAENSSFRDKFTNSISSFVTKDSDDEKAEVSKLKAELAAVKTDIQNLKQEIQTGGDNGLPIDHDGNPYNESRVDTINVIITRKESEKESIEKALFKAVSKLGPAERMDKTDLYGRGLAALYTASWLIAALLMVSVVIGGAANTFKESRYIIVSHSQQKKFFLDLENPDEEIRKSAIRSAVDTTLSRFSEILSVSISANKQDNLTTLFEESSYDKMAKAATEMVVAGIIPRESTITKILKYYRGNSTKK